MKEEYNNRLVFNFKRLFFIVALLVFNLISLQSFAQKAIWVAPNNANNVKNPFASNASALANTKTLYIAYCAPCHGDKGKGNGPAAPGLNPKPADHTSAAIQSETDGSLFWKLSEGRNSMASYKKVFSEQQRWELINYIRTLAKK